MHDATHIANGGKKSSQPRMHCWYVFDRNYCGHATTIPVSINDPTARMPWQTTPRCEQCASLTGRSDRPFAVLLGEMQAACPSQEG